MTDVTKALLVRVQAKEGKEAEVEDFLNQAALGQITGELIEEPTIEQVDVVAEKQPS